MMMIVMEMVGAMLVNVNAYLIMNMHKIAHIMDVSTMYIVNPPSLCVSFYFGMKWLFDSLMEIFG